MAISERSLLEYIAAHPNSGREDIRKHIAPDVSPQTIWRMLARLVDGGQISVTGKGRATKYQLAGEPAVRAHLNTPYTRRKPTRYQREFLDRYVPNTTFYLGTNDRKRLYEAGRPALVTFSAGTHAERILERLLIDLSWASSRMEGNTYDILETEKLIRYGQEASGKDHKEALMILNHKEAVEYLVSNLADIEISHHDICNIHALLADGLLVDPAMAGQLRRMAVGVSYSSYRPPDDPAIIAEEFDITIQKARAITDPFEQSFFLLVHLPYLQAFADVNKRTSRVAANIPLLKAELAPMSYLTMDDRSYIDGLIGVYELGNVSLLREVYLDAYLASAEHYHLFKVEGDLPQKATLAYRDFVRKAVRRCVLEWHGIQPALLMGMAADDEIPVDDRDELLRYIEQEFHGLHEGNAVRYRLTAEDLNNIVTK